MIETQQKTYPRAAADIVISGSVVGRHISLFSAAYGATKYAVHALAEGLRRDIGRKEFASLWSSLGSCSAGFRQERAYSDETVHTFKEKFCPLLIGDDVANAILYVVTRPPHVHISDIVVRPTRQDYR